MTAVGAVVGSWTGAMMVGAGSGVATCRTAIGMWMFRKLCGMG
jgi:hypothetical protein